jgi:16S rRNA (cytosine967-C5)-methyltransferase
MSGTSDSDTASRTGQAPRRAAFDVLRQVLRKGSDLESAITHSPRWQQLSGRDKAFARQLAATVLRRLGQLDAAIATCLDKPLKAKLGAVQDLLRLGAAQVLFMDVATHAAVGETVGLATGVRVGPHKGLLNAVLRRLSREGPGLLAAQDVAALNTPAWLWDRWCATYGEATARAVAAQHMREPPLDLQVVDPDQRDAWAETLGATVLPTGTLRLPPGTGDVRRLPGYDDGAWWVQDAAAALPARLLGDVADREVVDLCAAPGGKAAQLAAAGARVLAVDRSTERLQQLVANLERLSLAAATVAAEIQDWQPPRQPDTVLLDAPCTATGTLRRHPDIAHLKRPDDVPLMADLQAELLHAAAELLAPGGTLVYAVCSLEPEEGPERIAALLAARDDVERVPLTTDAIPGLPEAMTTDGDLRTLPHYWGEHGGLDGFYACRLRKR